MLDTARALAWRLRRQALDPASGEGVVDVTDRVVALRGWPADLADLTVNVRQHEPQSGALERALEAGEVIRSYAFRGGSYVFSPEVGAALLAVRTATRIWESPRWQRQGGFNIGDWRPVREAVCEALATGPLTREELTARLSAIPGLEALAGAALGAGSDCLYKPLHWWGDICFGPVRETKTTFRLLRGDPHWPCLPDVDDAGRQAVLLYLASYGLATDENLHYWLTEGLGAPRRRLQGWIEDLGDEVTEVTVDGKAAYALSVDLDEMDAIEASEAVRLLPGFDPWVMGPGTADSRIVAPERRALATRGANLAIQGGVVAGTWRVKNHVVTVSWFEEAGPAPTASLRGEVETLGGIRDQELTLHVA